MQTFAQHHNLDFKQPIPVHFNICNVTGKIGLDPTDANDRNIIDLLHKKKAVCNIFGYGCSKEGTIMIEADIVKALLSQSGLSLDNKSIAQAVPSDKTLDKYKAALAADESVPRD